MSDLVAQLQALQAQVAEANERVQDMVRARAGATPDITRALTLRRGCH